MLLRTCWSVLLLLTGLATAAVFVDRQEADGVLQRRRRANSGFFEEMKQGNLERECIEEKCNYEEAREVFEDEDRTKQFWLTYEGRNPCEVNPCQNNGSCLAFGTTHHCTCAEGYGGQHCETVVEDLLKCLYQNGNCEHFCDGSGDKTTCSCADGFHLDQDGKGCVPQDQFPCGRLVPEEANLTQSVNTRAVGASTCPPGDCPWQVLVQLRGQSHCGGVLIKQNWVITAAHCIHGNNISDLTVVAGENNLEVAEGSEQVLPVAMAIAHEAYNPATGDSDVALLRLSRPAVLSRLVVPVCLPTRDLVLRELLRVRYMIVSGWGKRTVGGNLEPSSPYTVPVSPLLRRFSVPVQPNPTCTLLSGFNFTNNMLCAGYLEGHQQSCRGDDGSPLVAKYGSTHFLTGVVGWGRGCQRPGYYSVYANMAAFVDWVQGVLKAPSTAASELLEQKRV